MTPDLTPEFPRHPYRSEGTVRMLSAEQLGLSAEPQPFPAGRPLETLLADDDPYLLRVRALLGDGFAGVIFFGPPGTGKSWYAQQIAIKLVDGDQARVRLIQFHPSFQYEDFMEGYVPADDGLFALRPKHFLEMCSIADQAPDRLCVLVIDELSRADPSRVFGEALTYIEMTRRGQPFHLASGTLLVVPANLVILATMNPLDRGVEEVDAAVHRRFAKIAMDPDPASLRALLATNGLDAHVITRVLEFFEVLQRHPNPNCKIGHAYFSGIRDLNSLGRLWDAQLRFHLESAFRLDPDSLQPIIQAWGRVISEPPQPPPAT